jgi:hypothetical protein
VSRAFGGTHGVPSSGDVSALCKLLESELGRSASCAEASLLRLAVEASVASVHQFCARTEESMAVGAEAMQLSGHVNNVQMLNVHRFNALIAMQWHVRHDLLPSLAHEPGRGSAAASPSKSAAAAAAAAAFALSPRAAPSAAEGQRLLEQLAQHVENVGAELLQPLVSSARPLLPRPPLRFFSAWSDRPLSRPHPCTRTMPGAPAPAPTPAPAML